LKSDKNIKNLNNEVEKMFKHFPPEAKSKAEVMHVFIGARHSKGTGVHERAPTQ